MPRLCQGARTPVRQAGSGMGRLSSLRGGVQRRTCRCMSAPPFQRDDFGRRSMNLGFSLLESEFMSLILALEGKEVKDALGLVLRGAQASCIVGLVLLISGSFIPVAFANTGGVSASPPVSAPNTTVSIQISATATLPAPSGFSNVPFFVAVLTPSGYIFGCISDSSACNIMGFSASGPGTYQCTIPFGGAASSLALVTSGGVSASDCSGSDSGTWTGMSSTLCGGVAPEGANCVGTAGFNDLVTGCTSASTYFIGFGIPNPPPSTGDTSAPGTYSVVVCWNFATQDPTVGGPVFSSAASTTTFQISPSLGVPQFPMGLGLLLAVMVSVLLFVRPKSSGVPK